MGDGGEGARFQNRSPMELVSPELVLVSSPEQARRAREQLPFPWEVLPRAIGSVETRRRGLPSLGVLGFGLFCVLNGVVPIALVIAAR
jgi:hypothetical protein